MIELQVRAWHLLMAVFSFGAIIVGAAWHLGGKISGLATTLSYMVTSVTDLWEQKMDKDTCDERHRRRIRKG